MLKVLALAVATLLATSPVANAGSEKPSVMWFVSASGNENPGARKQQDAVGVPRGYGTIWFATPFSEAEASDVLDKLNLNWTDRQANKHCRSNGLAGRSSKMWAATLPKPLFDGKGKMPSGSTILIYMCK
jgi:hypothetical protein